MRKTATALSEAARDALAAAEITSNGQGVKLGGLLPRPVYVEVAEALSRAGFKWNRSAQSHVLASGTAEEAIANLGVIRSTGIAPHKNPLNWYETPPSVARRVAELLCDWRPDTQPEGPIRILEPSVGEGALLLGLLDYLTPVRRAEFCRIAELAVTMVEIDTARGHKAFTALTGRFNDLDSHIGDFLAPDLFPNKVHQPQFDLILMNPPWERGSGTKHVLRAWELLAPGGRLVAILPGSSVPDLASHKIKGQPPVGRWESLPAGSFHDAGTDVNCGILVLDKP